MAYSTRYRGDTTHDMGTGRATWGVIAIFLSFGLALAILAFAAAFALRSDLGAGAPENAIGGASSIFVGLLPFIAAPILALIGGVWAATVTRNGGQGAAAGAIGGLVGPIVLFLLVALGFTLGAAAAGVTTQDVQQALPDNLAVPAGLVNTLQYFLSVGGIVYLLAHVLIGGITGAILGAIVPDVPRTRPFVDEDVERRPTRI